MIIDELTVTAFQQHTRIIGCETTKQAICIDPGDESERIVEILDRRGLNLQAIAVTHAHMDHVGGVASLKKLVPKAAIILHKVVVELRTGTGRFGRRLCECLGFLTHELVAHAALKHKSCKKQK